MSFDYNSLPDLPANILAKISITGYDDESVIMNALKALYWLAPESARPLMTSWLLNRPFPLIIKYEAGQASADRPDNTPLAARSVYLDPVFVSTLRGIDAQTGTVYTPQLEAVLWHEMMHVMNGDLYPTTAFNVGSPSPQMVWEDPGERGFTTSDWVDDYDFIGAQNRAEIAVSIELGLPYRPNYTALWVEGDLGVPEGDDFTGGQPIDLVIQGTSDSNHGDFSNRFNVDDTDERQLVFGFGGSDYVNVGGGNDVVHGGGGTDRFVGGGGADRLHGDEGRDIASYEDSDAFRVVFTVMGYGQGYDGEAEGDRLYDLETIIGSDNNDVVELQFAINSELAWRDSYDTAIDRPVFDIGIAQWEFPLSLIDVETLRLSVEEADTLVLTGALPGFGSELSVYAGETQNIVDSLDLSRFDSGLKYTKGRVTDGNLLSFEGKLYFRGFDRLTFGDGADRVIQDEAGTTIRLGEGNDHLQSTAAGTVAYGGAGSDFVSATLGGGLDSGSAHLFGKDGVLPGGATRDGDQDHFVAGGGQTFIHDADLDDHVSFGGVGGAFPIFGGVQQWWMEGGVAAWAPFSPIVGAAPIASGNLLFALATMFVDGPAMGLFQFGLTESNQLLISVAGGRAGAIVIEDYHLDLETGAATGNVVVFQQVLQAEGASLERFTQYMNLALRAGFGSCIIGTDPLILDLDGDGLELTSGPSTYFDLNADGFAERSVWARGGDGFLVRDLNANGQIDDITEMFGDADTPGFDALGALDSNSDGAITAADAGFASLRVWIDADGDGVTDAGELKTLGELGITSISVDANAPMGADATVRGNAVRADATFTINGIERRIADVLLGSNPTDTVWRGDSTISVDAAALPELKGFGTVVDLRIQMTDDATLLDLVEAFADLPATTSWTELREEAAAILLRWAGVDGVSAIALGPDFDTRKLAFLEAWFGVELTPRNGSGAPSAANAVELDEAWQAVIDAATVRLAAQGPLAEVFADATYSVDSDRVEADIGTTLADTVHRILEELPATSGSALAEWSETWAPMLKAFMEASVRHDGNLIRDDFIVMSLVRAMQGVTLPLTLAQLATDLDLENVLIGGGGADILSRSGSGSFVFVGDAGNDILTGSGGQGVYVFGAGFGQDTIIDADLGEQGDRIRFALHGRDDVTLARVGVDLVITIDGTADKITVRNHFAGLTLGGDYGVEEIQFADGTLLDVRQIAEAVGRGTSAGETLDGSALEDQIEGLQGNDTLRGGDGGDTYYFSAGHGDDVIHDIQSTPAHQTADMVIVENGLSMNDVVFSRQGAGDDLLMTFATGDSILIKGQFWYSSLGIRGGIAPEGLIGGLLNNPFIGGSNLALDNRMEAFLFKAGGSLTWLDVQNRLIEQHTTSAADVAHGFATGDRFGASAGNDIMYGYDGGDVYEFGRGSNADTIHDQALYLTLLGTDTVLFGEGVEFEDLVIKRIEGTKDLLISIAGTGDSLTIKEQFDGRMIDLFGIFGVQWFSRIETFRFADGSSLDWEDILDMVTTGGAGDDWLAGDFRVDTLNGGAGNDFLDGGDDGDVYMFGNGDGQDVIRDTPGYVIGTAPDKLVFKAGVDVADVVFTRDGSSDDLIVSIVGSTDQVRIQNQYVVTETGVFGALAFNQIEQFHWADGTIRTWTSIVAETIAAATTEGDDTILGWHFDDLIVGAGGDDLLKGGNGSDTYLFDLGDGADIILDHNVNLFTGNDDVIQFGAEISSGDIVLGRVGDDLVVSIDGTSDQITVQGHFQYSTLNLREYEMEAIRFDGGEAWTAADVRLRLIDAAATAGADIVAGFQTDDRLDGRAGDDVLRGGDGSDTYVFGLNFGSDTIEEFVDNVAYDDADAIEFAVGYDSGDVLFSRSGDDLIISFAGLGDQVVVSGQFDNAAWFSGWTDIEQITFGDDVVFTEVQIRETLLAQARTSGADTIEGFYTADALDGGAGNDILRGAGGGDTYAFGKGSGQDVIEETFATVYEDDPDTVLFSTGVARSEVTFTRVGDDMVVAIAGVSDTLTIRDHFVSTREGRVEFFRFANGTTLTAAEAETNAIAAQSTPGADTITGAAGDDLLDGGTGNDALQGNAGNDTYRFGRGYGQDTIQETSGTWGDAADALAFSADVLPEDLVLTRVGANLIIGISGTTDVLTIVNQVLSTDSGGIYGNQRIERFVFGDGTEWTAAEMDLQLLLAQQTSGNDTIVGYESDDVIDGGGGADFMQGGDGDDTYWFGRGSGSDTISETDAAWGDPGDAIRFSDGVVAGDLLFSRQGNNLIIKISGTTDQLVLVNQLWSTNSAGIYGAERVERFVFADGSELSAVEVEDRLLAAQQTSGNDSVYGYESSDVIDGGAGNDFLQGGQANDTYRFGLGDGVDVIDETNAAYGDLDDILAFKDGVVMDDLTWARSGNDLVISIAGTGDKVTIRNQFWSLDSTSVLGFGRIERFVFTDGSELSAPQIDALTLLSHQTSGNDTILGYSTPDRLDGGAGNDLMTGGGGADVYVFGRGYDQDTIDETNETYGAPNDAIAFATGVSQGDITWSRAGNDLVIRIVGTDDRLTIKNQFWSLDSSGVLGFGRVERFVFADGTELSAPEVDQLTLLAHQTPGADTVTGYSTADTIDAGTGNDLITGNGGNDTYFFGRGYGQDTIDETNGTYGDLADRVIFRADIAPEDLVLSRSGLDLVIGVGSDRLILRYQLFSTDSASLLGYNRVEYFEFAGGVVWTAADMDATLLDQAATAGDDVITGFASADTINGQGGDDELIGGAGNDQLRGSAGDDILSGGIGEDTALYADASTDIRWVRQADGSIHAINDVTAEVDVLRDVEGAWFEGDETYVAMNEAVAAYGTNGDDSWLPGTSGADSIYGRDGDDALVGRGGDDLLDGGEGYDQANYAGAFTDFAFQRAADGSIIVTDAAGPEGADTLTGVEAVYFEGDQTWKELENLVAAYGTSGSDAWLEGTEGSDDVYALAGDDSLVGRDGNDRLFGGDGYDQANYFGSSTDFSVVLNPDGTVTITDLVGDEGADVLDSVEAVYFEGDQTWSTIEDAIGGGGLTGLLQEKARGGASQPPGPEVLPSLPNDEHPLKVTDDGPPLVLPSLIGEDFLPKVTGDDGPLVLPGVADDGLPSGAGHPGRALLQALFASTHDAWTLQGRHGCLVDDFGGAAHKPVDDLLGF